MRRLTTKVVIDIESGRVELRESRPYRGRWARCGGPSTQPSQQISQQQVGLSQQQIDIAKQQNELAAQNYQRMLTLEQPAISYNQALASGDTTAMFKAAAPTLSTISSQAEAAKSSIYDTVAPGAARDFALSQLPIATRTAEAGALTSAQQQSYNALANLGAGFGGLNLQEVGAALSGLGGAGTSLSGASQTQQSIMGAQAQAKSSTMGFLGQLAGAAGTAAGGGAFGHL